MHRPIPTLALATTLATSLAAPALALETTGTVVAHDRVAHRLVMQDRTSYQYNPETTELPRAILAGDVIKISYRGGEDGVESISRIEIVTPGGSTDTAPTEDAAADAAAGDAPAGADAPAGDVPAEDATTEDATTGDAPADDVPASDG